MLEVLLLMRRQPDRAWDARALTGELRSSPLVTSSSLAALIAAGLVIEESAGTYRYRPARNELRDIVDRLAAAYAEYPFAVTQAVLHAPNDKVRLFADAFRIKKD